MFSITLPAGRYFVGDPCYVFPDADWRKFCDRLFSEQFGGDGNLDSFNDTPMFASGTAYGDGRYYDINSAASFGVDAGLIGAVPESLWDSKYTIERINQLGKIIVMETAFEARVTHDHEFHIGMLIIPTGDSIIDDDADDVDYSDIDED